MRQRIATAEAGLRRTLQSLPTTDDVAHLGQVLAHLQEHLTQVAAAVEALKSVHQAAPLTADR